MVKSPYFQWVVYLVATLNNIICRGVEVPSREIHSFRGVEFGGATADHTKCSSSPRLPLDKPPFAWLSVTNIIVIA